jgi:hypothetical protein
LRLRLCVQYGVKHRAQDMENECWKMTAHIFSFA